MNIEENSITIKQYIVCKIITNNLEFKAYTKCNKLIIITDTFKYIITTKTEASNFIHKYIDESKAKKNRK